MRLKLLFAVLLFSTPALAQITPDEDGPSPSQGQPPPPPQAPPLQQEYQPPPPQYPPAQEQPRLNPIFTPQVQFVRRRQWGLFAIGVGVFGGAYVGSVLDSLSSGQYLGTIPLAGPFLLYSSDNSVGNNVIYILDGLAQAAGATLSILGLVLTKKVPVYALVPSSNGVMFTGRW